MMLDRQRDAQTTTVNKAMKSWILMVMVTTLAVTGPMSFDSSKLNTCTNRYYLVYIFIGYYFSTGIRNLQNLVSHQSGVLDGDDHCEH